MRTGDGDWENSLDARMVRESNLLNKKSSTERASEIIDELESDDRLLQKFNLLLRQKKLKQLKDK